MTALIRIVNRICLPLVIIALFGHAHGQTLKLDYSTYLGGSGAERGCAVTTDAAGAIYVAGFTQSPDFPLIRALQPYYGGGTGDMFIAKLKPDASGFEYLTYIGGSGGEADISGYVAGIAADIEGNVYVAGVTRSTDFPTTPNAYQTTIGSQFECDDDPSAGLCGDAFVLKLSPAGDRLLYSTFLGGSDYDDAKAIAVDRTGAAYLTGVTASTDFPITNSAFQSQLIDVDAYVAKLSPDGTRLEYSTFIGGIGADAGFAIAVDDQGRACVAGTTEAADFPRKMPLQSAFGEPWDAFVLRLNASGNELDFSTLLGGQSEDEAFGITLDGAGDIYVVGVTNSPDFQTKNAFQSKIGGTQGNGFVTKIQRDGRAMIYSTFLGGGGGRSELDAIVVDKFGNAYVAGQGSIDFPVVNSIQKFGGQSDAVIAKLAPSGSFLEFSSFIGGSGLELASGIALDPDGSVVVTGQTFSANFPLSMNAFQSTLAGDSDAFIVRLKDSATDEPIFSSNKLIGVGPAYVGKSSATGTAVVTNLGAIPLNVGSFTATSNVQVATNCGNVSPGTSCSISAALIANSPGDQAGSITVYDDAPDSPQTIYVSGTGVYGGDLELSPLVTSSIFSYYGQTAVPITATVFNHGPNDADDVILRVISDGGGASCDPCYLGHVRAGYSATTRFTFLPSRYGMIFLTVRSEPSSTSPDLNPSNDVQTITIANPRYRLDPTNLTFPNQVVNLSSASRRITFTSMDQQPLQLTVATEGEFQAKIECEEDALTCHADVVFSPQSSGLRSGTLVVSEAGAGTEQAIQLAGTGVLEPHLKLSEEALVFVDGVTGLPGSPHTITLTNDGSAPLFLVTITSTRNFVEANQCPPSLMPGESCTVYVQFVPASAGTFAGSLTVIQNTYTMLNVINLTGQGVPLLDLSRPGRPPSSNHSSFNSHSKLSAILSRPGRHGATQITLHRPARKH